MRKMDYFGFMAVYLKGKAEYLRESIESIFSRTVLTDDSGSVSIVTVGVSGVKKGNM